MKFLVTPNTLWFMAIACALGGAGWIWLEFRRPNQRQRLARIAAATLAVLALAALGLRPAADSESPEVQPIPETAAVWTSSMRPVIDLTLPRAVTPELTFALPDAKERPVEALVIPDIAFLLREHPNVRTVHVFGDGVDEFDADTLRGVRVIYHRERGAIDRPAITFVRLPREIPMGGPIVVQGRVQGIAPETNSNISLTSPDGSVRSIPLRPGSDGVATFSLDASPAVSTGRFVWRMELRSGEAGEVLAREEIGISVIPPVLPRILILESAPHFDTGRLKRWLGESSAQLTVRTQLGRDRFRITTMHGSRDAVEAIDAGALAAFDLVIADAGALVALSEAERAALQTAIREDGLGALIVADETLLSAAPVGGLSSDAFLSTWKLRRGTDESELDGRLTRLQWAGSESAPPEALPVPNFEIERAARVQPLVRDGQNRTLVGMTERGRGRLALSLVTETWRWSQQRETTPFAAYWTFLFSELARRGFGGSGRWSIASNGANPQFVDEPVTLRWNGAADHAPMSAYVSPEDFGKPDEVALAQDPDDSGQWQAAYWPRRAGWHQVNAPGGATMDFFVSASGAWPAVKAARREAATARIAALSFAGEATAAATSSAVPVEFGRWWFFAILFASLAYLWSESRTLRRDEPISNHHSP